MYVIKIYNIRIIIQEISNYDAALIKYYFCVIDNVVSTFIFFTSKEQYLLNYLLSK